MGRAAFPSLGRRLVAGALLTIAVAGVSIATASSAVATPAYPPRANCALSVSPAGVHGITITGTGFTELSTVDLRVANGKASTATATAVGSFSVRTVVSGPTAHRVAVSATTAACTTSLSFDPALVLNGNPPGPGGPSIASATPLNRPEETAEPVRLGAGGLPPVLFAGVIALVVAIGLMLFGITSRTGRRAAKP
ncbi:MAG: hypothetical protein QOH56_4080 [Pseudonocardiales bacterium]|nr:hypothetical protein [Pseudonocardiales bacterium]